MKGAAKGSAAEPGIGLAATDEVSLDDFAPHLAANAGGAVAVVSLARNGDDACSQKRVGWGDREGAWMRLAEALLQLQRARMVAATASRGSSAAHSAHSGRTGAWLRVVACCCVPVGGAELNLNGRESQR